MTRTDLAVVSIIACALGAACSTTPQSARLYVTNERAGTLSVIDPAKQAVVATISLGKRPRGLRPSPDGTRLYVALSGSPIAGPGVDESTLPPPDKKADGIGVVDLRGDRLEKIIPGGSDPEQIAVSQDGKLLFVANEDVSQLSVIDSGTGATVASYKVGGEPEGVMVSPDGKFVYVTSEGDGAVFVVDIGAGKVVKTFEVPARPRSIAFLPDGSRAYVTSENGGALSIVDPARV